MGKEGKVRCSKKGLVLPIELALFSELWLGPTNGLGPIEVFPKAPFSKGSAIWGGPDASKWPKMGKWPFPRKNLKIIDNIQQ